MAATVRMLCIQLHFLDLLQDLFNERKKMGGTVKRERERNKIILTNERTNTTTSKSEPPPTTKFIIRFHST
jgi:hypothetical protein